MLIGRPIYLHFLDRELAKACAKPLTPNNALKALDSAIYATTSALYVGYSLLWESEALSASLRYYVQELSSLGIVTTLSSYRTVNEFLDSRHSMYHHVADEYPMYFPTSSTLLIPNNPNVRKDTHTTLELSRYFEDMKDLTSVSKLMAINAETLLELKRPLNNAIKQRDGKAITFNLFNNDVNAGIFIKHEYEMRRLISYGYTQYYLSLYPNSTILHGIDGLQAFDDLSRDYYLYDTPQLSTLLSYLALAPDNTMVGLYPLESALYASYLRSNPLLNDICENMSTLLVAIYLYGIETCKPLFLNYATLDRWSNPYKRCQKITSVKEFSDIQKQLGNAYTVSSKLVKHAAADRQLGKYVSQAVKSLDSHICDIVLLAVNKNEVEAICEIGKRYSSTSITAIGDNNYVDLGIIGDSRIVLAVSRAGSFVSGGSYDIASEVIKMYRPYVLISLGVAMGLGKGKDNIGDVIISNMIVDGDYKRVGFNEETKSNISISRGERVNADEMLVKTLLEHSYTYDEFKTIAKPIITASELDDYPNAAKELISMEPEARGYEMEGYGVYKACKGTNTSWIVVKGISDWGDGGKKGDNEEERQRLAARNAALLVMEAISKGIIHVRSITEYAQRMLPIIA